MAAVFMAACGRGAGSGGPSPTPSSEPLSRPALQLRVLAAVGGRLAYCDPDIYPVGHGTPLQNARERMPQIRKDHIAYRAILEFEHLDPGHLSNSDLIRISEDYKQIQVIELRPAGDGFSFSVLVPDSSGGGLGTRKVSGSVATDGRVEITAKTPGDQLNCPICLARGTRIAVPGGSVAVERIRVGMTVWSTDRDGRRIRATVLRVGRTPVPASHEVVRLVLADGRTVLVSPGHPTPDGSAVGALRAGDHFEGTRVRSAALVRYRGGFTFDLLPSGPTHTYYADGILLGSTLAG